MRLADGRPADEWCRVVTVGMRGLVTMAALEALSPGTPVVVMPDGVIARAQQPENSFGVVLQNNGDGTAVVQLW